MAVSEPSGSSCESDIEDGLDSNPEEIELFKKQEKIMELVCKSSNSPHDYELHLAAIRELSSDPLYSSQLEQQFKRFHAVFPLPVDLWLQYITLDPTKLLESFDDYLQPVLYYKYIEDLEGDDDAENKWNIVLRALGSHWRESENVYNLYRSFLKNSIENIQEQAARVKSSYQCQLSNPYFEGSERVLSEYRVWTQYQSNPEKFAGDLQSIENRIRGGRSPIKRIQEFENLLEKIAAADIDLLQNTWLEYCNFVIKAIKTVGCAIVISVLERAVASVCLSAQLWQRYLNFLEEMSMNVLVVAKRATRNIPFIASPWVALFVALECDNENYIEIHRIATDLCRRNPSPLSLDQLLEVMLAYCDAIRRSKRMDLLRSAFKTCKMALAEWPAGRCCLMMYEAKCMGLSRQPCELDKKWKDMWDEILLLQGNLLTTWQTCISECVRVGGTSTETRNYYKRGVKKVEDYPVALAEAWISFERESSDHVQEWINARKAYFQIYSEYNAKINVEQNSQTSASIVTERENSSTSFILSDNASKKRKHDPQNEEQLKLMKRRKDDKIEDRQQEYKKYREQDETNHCTVFLCEFNKSITKGDLENLFIPCGKIKDIRLVTRNRDSKASRGMAYVEFENEAGALSALKLDKELFQGIHLNIKPSKPPSKPSKPVEKDGVWKTCTSTIYVANINGDMTEDVLHRHFINYGQVQDIVILAKNQKKDKKAYALVEFANEDAVLSVLQEVHVLIEGISVDVKRSRFTVVEMRDQQAKSRLKIKEVQEKKTQDTKTVKGVQVSPRNAQRASVNHMVPRSLAKGKTNSNVPMMKSNSDFRKFYAS
ncbi:Aste57867_154 [Aphanomyces stellatus]|uniref:Aste57867_154 protein n=1 Tax=Aphanomyces stellatus TaxID=120398 RepID=A0A485K345_9STRA|nr:hypothetical protein As57867_000154 [Aphanomyces stellatus]VFT77380.1 Aste57867_154 [Aphanomyces stellatus]